ncbi:MAG: substrate-binding domain-containing protein [Ardenticatenaceae bacterium]|nr:substrate-binding domain-containing protein [Ardenticatenaceae bacterium]MCB8991365.1 substrate-binding domain-containing protein [Ardenticatenaceae bacterium]
MLPRSLAPLLLLLLLLGCQSGPLPPPQTTPGPEPVILRVGVADTAVSYPALAANPDYHLQLVSANNDTLFADLAAGNLDALLVHTIPENETLWFNPVAVDGLVLVVHPDNPVTNLTRGEVQAVFNGRISNWSTLGGPDLPITLVTRERGSGARTIFTQRIMAEQRVSINAVLAAGDTAVQEQVAATPGAIAYTMMGAANGVKVLELDGIPALPNTTAAQAYPLSVPLYFVSLVEPQGELRAWLAWLQSDEGQTAVAGVYGRVWR